MLKSKSPTTFSQMASLVNSIAVRNTDTVRLFPALGELFVSTKFY